SASYTDIEGGIEIVSSGGTDVSATINVGEQDVYGTANGVTLFGGVQVVESGGSASGTSINGGVETVLSGGSDVGATLWGGGQDVYGNASGVTINGGPA